jgi:hypothetical protein
MAWNQHHQSHRDLSKTHLWPTMQLLLHRCIFEHPSSATRTRTRTPTHSESHPARSLYPVYRVAPQSVLCSLSVMLPLCPPRPNPRAHFSSYRLTRHPILPSRSFPSPFLRPRAHCPTLRMIHYRPQPHHLSRIPTRPHPLPDKTPVRHHKHAPPHPTASISSHHIPLQMSSAATNTYTATNPGQPSLKACSTCVRSARRSKRCVRI